ncbi:hypothetical protein [Massilibacteroides sp.]|uniref:hypothetical protein n=1 Tax=Massilibacteroides sp. TaxID=2034766 RepID=UPI0026164304|nr:hypothetical protein [Massilibacteroides sp.]MDD4515433.1 hypothetical protein [Massilibacteroides sp.]
MKLQFLTIEIDGKCFDLPKDMQIPERGDTVFIEGKTGVVKKKNYHIVDGKVHMISIFATKV